MLEVEANDDGAAYSVEVELDGGRVVDVRLDRDLSVVAGTGSDDGEELGTEGATADD